DHPAPCSARPGRLGEPALDNASDRDREDPYAGSEFHKAGVFAAEIHALNGLPDAPIDADARPDVRHELAGLALSGGGIRSATFNLGVVQAINEQGLFGHLDYLSTVSGGGYLGSCISSILSRQAELPFRHEEGRLEHAAFRHLRNYANYLAPGGTGQALRLPAVVL